MYIKDKGLYATRKVGMPGGNHLTLFKFKLH